MKTINSIVTEFLKSVDCLKDAVIVDYGSFQSLFAIISFGKIVKIQFSRISKYVKIINFDISEATSRDSFSILTILKTDERAFKATKRNVYSILRASQKYLIKINHPHRFAINKILNHFIIKELSYEN